MEIKELFVLEKSLQLRARVMIVNHKGVSGNKER